MASDYENKAYSYLPGGNEYKPDPNERMYLPGEGVPQWRYCSEPTDFRLHAPEDVILDTGRRTKDEAGETARFHGRTAADDGTALAELRRRFVLLRRSSLTG